MRGRLKARDKKNNTKALKQLKWRADERMKRASGGKSEESERVLSEDDEGLTT